MSRIARAFCSLPLLLALASCALSENEEDVDIAFIGDPADLRQSGVRLSPTAQHIREATTEGLVAFDAAGDVVPAIAERWIVTDDGLSYIFRLRDSQWPDGEPMTAQSVKQEIDRAIARLDGTSLGLDLAIVAQVRAMAGRVVEIRLEHPMAQFLQLLAQPELGLPQRNRGVGPMAAQVSDDSVVLTALPPQQRGLPALSDWEDSVRPVTLRAQPAEVAIAAFEAGDADAVFDGRLQTLPLADVGPLSRGTIRVDSVNGLLGLKVRRARGLLAENYEREALAMAIDRGRLFETLNLGQWRPTTRIVPALGAAGEAPVVERWANQTIEQRRTEATRRVAGWIGRGGGQARVAIALPHGPGSDRVFGALKEDFAAIGVTLARVANADDADLVLLDSVARYTDKRWFLNQLNCRVSPSLCSREADLAVIAALREVDPAERDRLLLEAETILLDRNGFIPLGAPIRWALVRGGVDGFEANRTGFHPLFPLALRPI